MKKLVDKCLDLIIKDSVDEAVQAFRDAYFWYVKKEFPTKASYEDVLDNLLNRVSETLGQNEYERMTISEEEIAKLSFRRSSLILNVLQEFMIKLKKIDGINFLGELIGAYALVVPEPLFRTAKTYSGLHRTPDIPTIDDNLPMTDAMILYAWQYDWFYSWLGY